MKIWCLDASIDASRHAGISCDGQWIVRRIWSHRYKRWRNGGWRWLPKKTLYHGLVNLIGLIPSLASRNESLRESCIREKRTCSLSGGRRPARKRTCSDPTPMNHSNKDRRSLAESETGKGSGRQCCGSSKVQVLVPSIACFGRLAYPVRAEATKHVLPGCRSLGRPMALP